MVNEHGAIEGIVAGSLPLHELDDLGITEMPRGPYVTVAGLVLDHLNHLPDEPGGRVVISGWEFEVARVADRTIAEVVVRPATRSTASTDVPGSPATEG